MNQFNTIMAVVNIVLVAFLVIWTILDKKKVFKVLKDFDQKKNELVDIINDAEQMIEELNKFSDYIVTQMDLKDEELRSNLKKADEQIMNIAKKAQEIELQVKSAEVQHQTININSDILLDNVEFESPAAVNMDDSRTANKRTEKVVPINGKYSEVLKLSKDGLNESEIAKKLKMGKGEIQLILGITKN